MILLLQGCLTLDFLFFGGTTTDAYDLDGTIPADLVEEVSFDSGDGVRLSGVWAHQDDAEAPVLVFFHGKSSHIGDNWPRVEVFHSWGYEVFVFDYRGYGTSDGEQEGDGILNLDGRAAIAHVESRGTAVQDQIWTGLSLGGAVALHTLEEAVPRALVLESVFASSDLMLDRSSRLDLPPAWFVETEADNVARIRAHQVPVFILHGLDDDFVAPESGELLFDAATEPKELWLEPGVNHVNFADIVPDAYERRFNAFVESH